MRRGKQEKAPFVLKNGKEKVKPKIKEKGQAELKAGRGKAKLGDKEETRGAKAKEKDRRERPSGEGKKRTKWGQRGRGLLQALFSSAAAETACYRAFGGQDGVLMGKRSWDVPGQLPCSLGQVPSRVGRTPRVSSARVLPHSDTML